MWACLYNYCTTALCCFSSFMFYFHVNAPKQEADGGISGQGGVRSIPSTASVTLTGAFLIHSAKDGLLFVMAKASRFMNDPSNHMKCPSVCLHPADPTVVHWPLTPMAPSALSGNLQGCELMHLNVCCVCPASSTSSFSSSSSQQEGPPIWTWFYSRFPSIKKESSYCLLVGRTIGWLLKQRNQICR